MSNASTFGGLFAIGKYFCGVAFITLCYACVVIPTEAYVHKFSSAGVLAIFALWLFTNHLWARRCGVATSIFR